MPETVTDKAIDPRVWRIGRWLQDEPLEKLADRLLRIVERNAELMSAVQDLLVRRIPDSPPELREMYLALDQKHYAVGVLLAEAEALLDKAELVALPPCGTSVICKDRETGLPVPAAGSKVVDQEDPDFRPKTKELTEIDRSTIQAAECAAFRRFRNEVRVMAEGITNRLFNIKGMARLDGGP